MRCFLALPKGSLQGCTGAGCRHECCLVTAMRFTAVKRHFRQCMASKADLRGSGELLEGGSDASHQLGPLCCHPHLHHHTIADNHAHQPSTVIHSQMRTQSNGYLASHFMHTSHPHSRTPVISCYHKYACVAHWIEALVRSA